MEASAFSVKVSLGLSDFACIVNGTYEIWLQKAADNSYCDHIKQPTFVQTVAYC